MATRNYWLDATIDGRATKLSGGPQSKNGGMSVSVKMRDGGEIIRAVQIEAFANDDGTLTLIVDNMVTREQWQIDTKR
jgi:hypothetical protein